MISQQLLLTIFLPLAGAIGLLARRAGWAAYVARVVALAVTLRHAVLRRPARRRLSRPAASQRSNSP